MEIDVVIPFHKNDKFFHDSVNSIANSRFIRPRIILVDDRPISDDSPLPSLNYSVLVNSFGVGYSKALRLGLKQVASKYFAIQDSDDLSHPIRLYSQVKDLEFFDADISICGLLRINSSGTRRFLQSPHLIDSQILKLTNLLGSYNSNSSWVCKSNLLEDKAFLPSSLRSIDWATTLTLSNKYRVSISKARLYKYRIHGAQMTQSQEYSNNAFQEIYELWTALNYEYRLPYLNFAEASLIAAPWSLNSNYVEEFELKIKNLELWIQQFFTIPFISASKDKTKLKILLIKKICIQSKLFEKRAMAKLLNLIHSV